MSAGRVFQGLASTPSPGELGAGPRPLPEHRRAVLLHDRASAEQMTGCCNGTGEEVQDQCPDIGLYFRRLVVDYARADAAVLCLTSRPCIS